MSITPKLKPSTLRRYPGKHKASAQKLHGQHIGELAIAWNALHQELFLIFHYIVAPGNYRLSQAIWHAVRTDSAQAEMAREAGRNGKLKKNITAHIEWVFKRLEILRPYRNYLIHMPVGYVMQADGSIKVIPDRIGGKPTAWEALTKTPAATFWRKVKGDLITLAQFCTALWQEIFYGSMDVSLARLPLPRRPRMLTPRLQTKINVQKPHPSKRKGKQRQRKTSPPTS